MEVKTQELKHRAKEKAKELRHRAKEMGLEMQHRASEKEMVAKIQVPTNSNLQFVVNS
jgi:hypothetical protein